MRTKSRNLYFIESALLEWYLDTTDNLIHLSYKPDRSNWHEQAAKLLQ